MELQKVEIMAAFCGQLHENNVEISVENIKKVNVQISNKLFRYIHVIFTYTYLAVVKSSPLWRFANFYPRGGHSV